MNEKLADFLEIFGDTNKTAVMLLLLIIGTALRLKGYIDGTQIVDMLKTVTVSYFGTTTITHFTGMIKDHLASKSLSANDLSDKGKS